MAEAIHNFLTVGQQVLILFILILIGYVLGKKHILGEKANKAMSDVALLLSTPCVIALSFEKEFSVAVVKDMGIALLVAAAIHVVAIVVAQVCFRGDDARSRVLRTGTVLSNAGFMGLPLQRAVLGEAGVFYGSAYVTAFTLTLWSYGLLTMDRSSKLSVRKLLLNPGVLGLAAGAVILVMPWELPELLRSPMQHIANLNTPLPMLVIGYGLSRVDLKNALRKPLYYGASAVRLLLVPLLGMGVLYLCGVRDTLLISMSISATAPVAAGVSMFADKFGQDRETAVNMVALSTVFSVITMPVLVALVQSFA